MIGEYAFKAGLTNKVTPHMLRHSFATHLYGEMLILRPWASFLGHAEIRSTAVYTHVELKQLGEGVQRLSISAKLDAQLFPRRKKAMLLQTAIERYLEFLEFEQRGSEATTTLRFYVLRQFQRYLESEHGITDLEEIKINHLRSYLAHLRINARYQPISLRALSTA